MRFLRFLGINTFQPIKYPATMIKVIDKNCLLSLEDLNRGAALLVDKPVDWTSFDVVNKVRFAIGKTLKKKRTR